MPESTKPRSALLEVSVTVGGHAWRRVADFRGEASASDVYGVHVDADGGARVVFGNGVHGQRPAAGAVIDVSYRSGHGRAGNLGRVAPLGVGVSGLSVALPRKSVEVSLHEVRRRWPPW